MESRGIKLFRDFKFVAVCLLMAGALYLTNANADIRINAGGSEYTDSNGNVWLADMGYTAGNAPSSNAAIAGTTDDALYQRWRSQSFTYGFVVANGSYLVKLHLSENWSGGFSAGARVFDVKMEDSQVLNDVDVYSQAGAGRTALILPVPVNVLDGELNIDFIPQVHSAMVSAIETVVARHVDKAFRERPSPAPPARPANERPTPCICPLTVGRLWKADCIAQIW